MPADRESVTGVISAQNSNAGGAATANSAVEIDTTNCQALTMQTVGTYGVSALSIQVTNNGKNWITLGGSATVTRQSTGVPTATVTAAEQDCYVVACQGFMRTRVTALGAITGQVTVSLRTVPSV